MKGGNAKREKRMQSWRQEGLKQRKITIQQQLIELELAMRQRAMAGRRTSPLSATSDWASAAVCGSSRCSSAATTGCGAWAPLTPSTKMCTASGGNVVVADVPDFHSFQRHRPVMKELIMFRAELLAGAPQGRLSLL